MPGFADENTIDDIKGVMQFLIDTPPTSVSWRDEMLAELRARLQDKQTHNRNRVRDEWYTRALDCVERANVEYRTEQLLDGAELLRQAQGFLDEGNRAALAAPAVDFVVDSDGEARPS